MLVQSQNYRKGVITILQIATETVTMGLSTYLQTLGTIVSAVTGWAVKFLEVMTSNPILLVPFGVIAVFTAIKVLKKIF